RDRDALAGADALVVFFAGPGRESHTQSGDPDDPWSNYTAVIPPPDDPPLREASVIAEEEMAPFSSFGVLCHEFGHLLGLPELYAPGGAAHEGVGVWDLMGQGTWLGRGDSPPGLSAWSKLRLGWVDVETVTTTTPALALPAVQTTPRVVKIPAVPGVPEEYYLLENRARIGVDRSLPGEGLLVWHVDERVRGFRSGESDPAHKLLHLVEADGRGDLDRGHAAGGNRGDATDPWRGPPPWRRRAAAAATLAAAVLIAAAVLRAARARAAVPVSLLLATAALLLGAAWPLRGAPVCGPGTPGMSPYEGGPVRVVLRNLSPASPVMHVDVLVAPPGPDSLSRGRRDTLQDRGAKLIIQIPCFNEEEHLAETLRALPSGVPGFDTVETLVVDDGSTDATSAVAKRGGATYLLRLPVNVGLARAFSAGLDAALKLGADVIVNTDADHQYRGADVARLVAPILSGEAEMVIGDRAPHRLQHFGPVKRLLQAVGSWVVRQLSGTSVPDATSGFRAFSRRAALKLNVFTNFTY